MISLVKIRLCSKLHRQKTFKLKVFSYMIMLYLIMHNALA